MSATFETVSNPALVRALLHGDGDQLQAGLAGATLLVPASENRDGEPVIQIRRGAAGRRLICAFTDLEALQAWDRNPTGAAAVLDASEVAGLLQDAMVVLNPAGPGAHVLDGDVLADAYGSAASDEPTPTTNGDLQANGLTDPARRRPLRVHANQFHELARRTAEAGDLVAACEQLQPAISACDELGDRLHGAAAALELASWRAKSGSTRLALTGWREAATTMAALGELDLALDALLDAAQTAARAGLTADAEALSVTALDLAAGSDFSDRLIGVWRMLAGAPATRADEIVSVP
jgi:type III secretion system (T3SS) SseB-like protein